MGNNDSWKPIIPLTLNAPRIHVTLNMDCDVLRVEPIEKHRFC
jgi:hypothetical protein